MPHLKPVATAIVIVLSNVTMAAPPSTTEQTLDTVTVIGTRSERSLKNSPGTISVKTRAELQRELAQNIKDAVRYEPGISIANQPSRFGLAGFNVRGLDGNRVLIEVDGARVSDSFSIGSFSNAGRDAVELDVLKRIDIVRGSASSLYGSSAMGGVVAFSTQDPEDYLDDDTRLANQSRLGFAGDNNARYGGSTFAFGVPQWGALVSVSERQLENYQSFGTNNVEGAARDVANPQEGRRRALLAKLGGQLQESQRLMLTLDANRADTETNVLSGLTRQTLGPSTIQTTALRGFDQSERTRAALEYVDSSQNVLWSELTLRANRQSSETTQATSEQRTSLSSGISTPSERLRSFLFEQDLTGLEARAQKTFGDTAQHHFTYGVSALQTDTEQLRTGSSRTLTTGAISTVIGPDNFPVRDFPNSKTREDAVYAQLEYSLGALQVIPGVRLDRYRLTPQPDAIFIADNPGISPTRLSETATSPKLGALYALNDVWTLHGQYATGFRAPPYNDVNVGFTNLQFGYTAIPNSNLKSERSRGIEAGIRASAPLGFLDLTIYRNRYDDFIESFFLVGRDSASNLSIFQSRNLNEVAIRGAELRAGVQLDEINPAFEGFSLRAAASYSHGDQLQSDRPLNSIDPRKAVLGLQYQAARFGVEMVGSFVGRKGRIDESSGSQFRPAGYAKYDLLAHWQIGHHFTLNLGVFNVFDRAYFDWSDVRGRPANDPAILRYSGQRRSLNAALNFNW